MYIYLCMCTYSHSPLAVCRTLLLLRLKCLAVCLFPSAFVAPEGTDEEVMLHSCVLDHSLHQMRSWPVLADHIVHVFQYEVIVFVCRFLFIVFCSPLLLKLCLILFSSIIPLYVELDLCLSVIPLPPPRSPPKSP